MLNFDVKRKINILRDILVGKVPDPKAQVEQITIALIYKFMDDMDLQGVEFGGERVFFKGDYEKYAFSQIMLAEHSAQERLNFYAEGMDKMATNPDLPQLFREILRNTYIPYRDPETLNRFLKEIAEFSYDDSEELGNAFEYLLSIMGSQGDAGQFRTPRHIIDMMVEIIAPQKNEKILDPACGTAGFLISAFNYIKNHNLDASGNSTLSADDKNRMTEGFAGYDISPDMVRLSRVNMYLHGFTTPHISEYDTLTSIDKWDDDYDVIFANPPFMTPKGGIIPHARYYVNAKRAEVLFVDYIAEHLNPTGRAAIIVPEGIVFQSQTAYKSLRKFLVNDGYLYGVISLPAGVFNPYSGVKTSVLLINRTLAKEKDSILFVRLNNDGFELGAQRREIKGSEIPFVIKTFKDYQDGIDIDNRENVVLVKKNIIAEQDYVLVGERYSAKVVRTDKWKMVKLENLCIDIRNGINIEQINENGKYRVTRIQTISEGVVNLSKTKWTNSEPPKTSFMQAGDILLSHINSYDHLAKSAIFPQCDEKVVHGVNLIRISPDRRIVLPEYLEYCLKSEAFVSKAKSFAQRAVNQASIKVSDLKTIEIPLPPLSVQEEIVAEVEGYQKVIDGARQVVNNYKPTYKVNPEWEVKKIGDLCELNPHKSKVRSMPSDTKVSFAPMADISDKDMLFEPQETKTLEEVYNSYTYFENSDILLAKVTPCFENGKSGIAHNLINGIGFGSSELYVLRIDMEKVLPELIYYTINSNAFLAKGKNNMTGTGGLRRLTKEFVLNYPIAIPPTIKEQREIVVAVEQEMAIINQHKNFIEIFQQKIKDKIDEVWGE